MNWFELANRVAEIYGIACCQVSPLVEAHRRQKET